jgi:uncharacterized membrane protein
MWRRCPAYVEDQAMRSSSAVVPGLWGAVLVLAIIGVAAAVGRLLNVTHVLEPSAASAADPTEVGFARYPWLTMVHIVPGALFMVLGPLQLVRRIRSRHIGLHRWSGRVFVASGIVIGGTALIMAPLMAIGGANETAASTFFAIIFLFALGKAVVHIRRGDVARHREWMLRAFAIGLAIATVRPIIVLFFALGDLSPREFFGIAFWLGFTSHLVAAEVWIQHTRAGDVRTRSSGLGSRAPCPRQVG